MKGEEEFEDFPKVPGKERLREPRGLKSAEVPERGRDSKKVHRKVRVHKRYPPL